MTNHHLSLVCIVTYKSGISDTTVNVLTKWLELSDRNRLVVLENSGDRVLVDQLRRRFGRVGDYAEVELAESNVGFSPGVNRCFEIAAQRWQDQISVIVLLNPDVETCLRTLTRTIDRVSDDIGISAPALKCGELYDRGSMRRRWNRRRLIAEVAGYPRLASMLLSEPRSYHISKPTHPMLVDVDITSGAFMAINAEVFGPGMDTRLPMYLEDQEICHRAHKLGYRVTVDTELEAQHAGGASRKLNSGSQRWLRVTELAEAPAISLADWTGAGSIRSGRVAVFVGSAIRMCISGCCWIAGFWSSNIRSWSENQLILSRWLLAWAVNRSEASSVLELK